MGKNRLEAFSDGVLAIIITIMVLEIKVPHGDNVETLMPLAPDSCMQPPRATPRATDVARCLSGRN